jgi:hypothetical protein
MRGARRRVDSGLARGSKFTSVSARRKNIARFALLGMIALFVRSAASAMLAELCSGLRIVVHALQDCGKIARLLPSTWRATPTTSSPRDDGGVAAAE